MVKSLGLFLGLLLVPSFCVAGPTDLEVALNALPGVVAKEKTTADDASKNVRRFSVTIDQPVDHFNPKSGTFKQKLVLFHRGYSEPMVLQTSGYMIFGERLSRLASVFGANQLQVEHRFFGDSIPEPKDWSKLTVRQSAADFHRIVETFKSVYPARWVSTGASKGGMTSVFHRRYYPNDLAGTVADVAPFSYSLEDKRYVDFVDRVGGEKYASCRAKLYALQSALLRRGAEVLPEIEGNFSEIGDKLIAYEQAVIEMPFVFWQYGNPESGQWGCRGVPSPDASAREITAFLKVANTPNNYDNSSLVIFRSYFFQAAVELGAPGAELSHLNALLKYPYVLDPFLPKGVDTRYSNGTMLDMKNWVANEGSQLLFVYGEFDPWTAGAFPALRAGEKADNHQFVVAAGNHGANFSLLDTAVRAKAMAVLARWMNKNAVQDLDGVAGLSAGKEDDSLEALELRELRKRRLR